MERNPRTLRLQMNGRWECLDLGMMCLHLQDIYHLRLVLEGMREDVKWQHELAEYPDFLSCAEK